MKSKLFTSKEDKDEDKERVLSDEMKTRSTQSGNSDKSGRLPKEIDWEHLDKSKFFLNGIGAFSLATLALYPLSVVKTRQMLEGTKIQTPFKDVVKNVIKDRGFKGLYAGFGTVVFGAIPLRMVYLSTLEYTKGNGANAVREVRGGGDVLRDRGRGWWSDGIVRESDVRNTDRYYQSEATSEWAETREFYQGRDVEPFVVGGEE